MKNSGRVCKKLNENFNKTLNYKGVTLVEILISLTILVLVTGALSSGTNYLTRRLVRAKNAAIARNLAWKKLAEIKSRRIEPFRRSGVFGREFENFKYSEEIKPANVNGLVHSGLYQYELTVSWPEAWQEDRVTFSTLIADYLQAANNLASPTEKNEAVK
ncbi:MAG: prepilin-type N-terminal cleavage/methylation domain-containing protein [Candidatus Riflebacteria bacterium]